ncbi:hypothetical protein [Psychromonas aquimarina]|uniref:hypothetical protein n=1 Tax=Psychromonas aquimarina TaxID=444919 RepID=UPI000405BF85|nr:hypothetical protein [Psychromonas aquimarina]
MKKQQGSLIKFIPLIRRITCIIAAPIVLAGCATAPNSVIVTSATVIGVDISQDQATQAPSATLGYKRAEFAYVPTNKGEAGKSTDSEDTENAADAAESDKGLESTGNGAKDSANVLMELRYSGIFSTGNESGIYQRLAVGDIAVKQEGASVLFAKDAGGNVDKNAAKFVTKANIKLAEEEMQLKTVIVFLKNSTGALDVEKRDSLIAQAKINAPQTITTSVENALKKPAGLSELNALMADDLSETIFPMYKAIP